MFSQYHVLKQMVCYFIQYLSEGEHIMEMELHL